MTASDDKRVDPRLAGISDEARLFFDYWDSLPKEALIPYRNKIDPIALKSILPDIVICQYRFEGEGAMILSLIGTRHVERWGRELTGANYLEFVPPERRAVAWARQRLIVEHPCGTHSFRIESFASGRKVRLESIALPMRSKDGAADLMVLYSREVSTELANPWLLGPGQAFADSQQSRFIDIGAGIPSDPAVGA